MDVIKNKEVLNEFNLPPEDYDDRGQVRVLRKRVIKKMLKYEFKALFSWLWIALGVLAGVTALMVALMFTATNEEDFFVTMILPLVLYIYTLVAVTLAPFILASVRYNKNFFKNQGYLTFSIPASMEEQVFAKRVSAIVCELVALVASFVSALIVIFVATSVFGVENEIVVTPETTKTDWLSLIETAFYAILSLVGVFCVTGALDCWGQKFKKKSQIFVRVLIAYAVIIALESAYFALELRGAFNFFYTPVGGHVASWLGIVALAGAVVLSVWYELKTLKRNLNLK